LRLINYCCGDALAVLVAALFYKEIIMIREYTIENLPKFVEILPLNQIGILTMKELLGNDNIKSVNKIESIVRKANNDACSHCGQEATNSKMTITPECILKAESKSIQVVGLKSLCNTCSQLNGFLVSSIEQDKSYKNMQGYKRLVELFKGLGGADEKEIKLTVEGLHKEALELQNGSFTWDLYYLSRRNIVERPTLYFDKEIKDAKDQEIEQMKKTLEDSNAKVNEAQFQGIDMNEVAQDVHQVETSETSAEHFEETGFDGDANGF